MPISILGLDITGEDVHETGLIWDYRRRRSARLADPRHAGAALRHQPPRGQVLMSMYHLDGQPMSSDPRLALARQVDDAGRKGPVSGRRLRAGILPACQ